MSKLYDLICEYGSDDITLSVTVNVLLNHAWIYPKRYNLELEELHPIVIDSWEEVEKAFNDGKVDFLKYRILLRTFDDEMKIINPPHGIPVPNKE